MLKVCKFIFEWFQEFLIILTIMSFRYSAVHLAGYRKKFVASCTFLPHYSENHPWVRVTSYLKI